MKASLKRLASAVLLAQSLKRGVRHLLSLLPKRMAKVCASGSPSETSVATFQTQDRSLPTLGDNFISGVTTAI